MKVVLLAGGFGTRIAEYTELIPKPMVKIGNYPIIWHIMNIYSYYGYNDFVIALGYKSEVIKNYFLDYVSNTSDIYLDLKSGKVDQLSKSKLDWKVTLVETGLNSMTGGRIKRLRKYIGDERFMCTYGDGVSNVNINDLVNMHKSKSKIATVTTVHPVARFGEVEIENDEVKSFAEKPQTGQGWINGGFFVFEPEIFDYIDNDETVLEALPLENLAKNNQLSAFRHEGFWQCMDTIRDKKYLETLWQSNKAEWKLWN